MAHIFDCLSPMFTFDFSELKGSYILGLTLFIRAKMVGRYMGHYSVMEVFIQRVLGTQTLIFLFIVVHPSAHFLRVFVGHGWYLLGMALYEAPLVRLVFSSGPDFWLLHSQPDLSQQSFRGNLIWGPAKVDRMPQGIQPLINPVSWEIIRVVG